MTGVVTLTTTAARGVSARRLPPSAQANLASAVGHYFAAADTRLSTLVPRDLPTDVVVGEARSLLLAAAEAGEEMSPSEAVHAARAGVVARAEDSAAALKAALALRLERDVAKRVRALVAYARHQLREHGAGHALEFARAASEGARRAAAIRGGGDTAVRSAVEWLDNGGRLPPDAQDAIGDRREVPASLRHLPPA